jgi:glycopeptide antibiotics resistance protein
MRKVIKLSFGLSFVLYLFVLLVLLFLGTSRGYMWADLSWIEYIKSASNFVPFKTIKMYMNAMIHGSMNVEIPIKNLIGNFIMFIPMGMYLPFFIKRINSKSIFFTTMFFLLFVIEVIQLGTRRGSFDIDDFILNMAGALIGFSIWRSKFVSGIFNKKNHLEV